MNIIVKKIDKKHESDINIPNNPFSILGRMKVTYKEDEWSYEAIWFDKDDITEQTFPDENYNYDTLSKEHIFVGAYDGNMCIGLAIYRYSWNKYLYLYDIKVKSEYRKFGVGRKLIKAGQEIANEHGYNGIYTQGQDNNIIACLFYIKIGFQIGGLDTHVYRGTSQANKSDIIFYLTDVNLSPKEKN